ncbi:MAG: SDR family oxidoreductase [Verrucomicrobia bacterium]|nr:SDR family oxidoreductase [Verrucomicrobiota bacterium]
MRSFSLQARPPASGRAVALAFAREGAKVAIPLGRILMPDDIANPVLFLSSAQAANITGASLAVDGGFVLG